MGMKLFGNCGVYPESEEVYAQEPNPAKFKILEIREVNEFVIALIEYPDCQNYEGIKLCVYHDIDIDTIKNSAKLDPHFSSEYQSISPIARFEPSIEGRRMANFLIKNYQSIKGST